MSTAKKPEAEPVAIPMFAVGSSVHQALMILASIVASRCPWGASLPSGVFLPGVQGKTAQPRRAKLNARSSWRLAAARRMTSGNSEELDSIVSTVGLTIISLAFALRGSSRAVGRPSIEYKGRAPRDDANS